MNFFELIQKYQKFIIYSIVFLAIVAFFSGVLAVGIMLVAFLGAITFLFINRSKEHAKILGLLFLVVFIIHIIATLFVFYTNFQPFSGGRGDFTEYAAIAQEVSNRIHQGNFSLKGLDLSHYYPVIVGYLYAITTPSALIGELFNAWLLAILVITIYFLALKVGASKKEAFIVGLIANFYPSLAFYASLLLKETLAGLLCMLALLMMLKIIKEFSWPKFFIFYVLLLGVTHFRFYISNALILSFIICWLLLSSLKIKKRLLYGILMIVLLGFVPYISGGEGVGAQYFQINVMEQYLTPQVITALREETTRYDTGNETEISQSNPKQVAATSPKNSQKSNPKQVAATSPKNSQKSNPKQVAATSPKNSQNQPAENKPTVIQEQTVKPKLAKGSESSVIIKTGFENPFTFLKNTLWSYISALLGPFPWQLTKPQHLFILPEIIAWYFLLFFIIKGIVKSIKTQYKVIIPLVVFSIIVFGVLGLFINNYGITTRIRIPAVLSLLCLFPLGFRGFKIGKIPFLNYLDKYIPS